MAYTKAHGLLFTQMLLLSFARQHSKCRSHYFSPRDTFGSEIRASFLVLNHSPNIIIGYILEMLFFLTSLSVRIIGWVWRLRAGDRILYYQGMNVYEWLLNCKMGVTGCHCCLVCLCMSHFIFYHFVHDWLWRV